MFTMSKVFSLLVSGLCSLQFFSLRLYIKRIVYIPPLLRDIDEQKLKSCITDAYMASCFNMFMRDLAIAYI